MKVNKIFYTSVFLKKFKKTSLDKKLLIKKREKIFLQNCFDKRLKTHKLTGKYKNYWSFSITYSERIIFRFLTTNKVVFMYYGGHEIYN